MVNKLKAALDHLPKVTKKGKIYQGDFMYNKDDGDVTSKGGKHHFTPNTITYSTPHGSAEGKKIDKAKIGVAVHTSYSGNSMDSMKVNYNHDTSDFGNNKDVHIISPKIDHKAVKYSPEAQEEFKSHMKLAADLGATMKHDHLIGDHGAMLKIHINKTVRDGTTPSVDGLKNHISTHFSKKADKVKSDAAKQRHLDVGNDMNNHVDLSLIHI